ncbi:MAG TPA: hypothetical protein VNW06_10820 [Cytophagaceae bacterium]|jgi:hypothetical protein|nr:hypothetical protein [Cytophagaceae bacterium]
MKGIFKKGIGLFLLIGLFACTDSSTDNVTSDSSLKDTLFTFIQKTTFTGIYDTLDYTLLVNSISKEQYQSIGASFSEKERLIRDTICNVKEEGCMEALESYYISKFSDKVKRKGETLTLSLSDGKTITLTNNKSDNDSYEVYQFVSLDQNGYFIVAAFYMESYAYLLINSTDGKTIRTIGYPIFSPDKKQYVAGNYDMMASFTFNGIDLMTVSTDSVISNAKIDFTTWGPEDIKWKDDSTLYVKQKSQIGDDLKEEYNYAAIRIRRRSRI